MGERISDPRTCLKCEFLDSTPDLLPWRCRALRSHILASPQGDSDVHLSLRAPVLVGGEAMEECLPCSQQKGHCSFRDGSTAGLEGPLVDEVIAQVLPRYQGTNLPLGILTQRSRMARDLWCLRSSGEGSGDGGMAHVDVKMWGKTGGK